MFSVQPLPLTQPEPSVFFRCLPSILSSSSNHRLIVQYLKSTLKTNEETSDVEYSMEQHNFALCKEVKLKILKNYK